MKKYYVKDKVVIPDKDLDVAPNWLGARFITRKAVIAGLVWKRLYPFLMSIEIKTIPDGLVYTDGKVG